MDCWLIIIFVRVQNIGSFKFPVSFPAFANLNNRPFVFITFIFLIVKKISPHSESLLPVLSTCDGFQTILIIHEPPAKLRVPIFQPTLKTPGNVLYCI